MKPQLSKDVRLVAGSVLPVAPAAVYFFDLAPALELIGPASLSNPERFRLVCERHVRSIIGSDFVLFTDQGFYLVVTSCSGDAAAGLARYINMSLLTLLFGTDHLKPDEEIVMYRSVEEDELPGTTAALMPDVQRSRFHRPRFDAEDGVAPGSAADPLRQLAQEGVYLDQGVELSFFPVHDLRRKALSALFCAPTFAGAVFGHQAFQDLNQAELPYIDCAILMHSLTFATRLEQAGIPVAVGAPVSFETLAWSKSREIYQAALRGAKVNEHPQLILKIDDVPPGTPSDRITRLVSSLRPFARHIFVQLPNNHIELTMTGRMGASGLVLSLQRRAPLPEVQADSKWLSRAAVAQQAMSCIDHVESDEALATVRAAGIRFAVGHVFGAETLRGTASVEEVRTVLARIEAATVAHLGSAA